MRHTLLRAAALVLAVAVVAFVVYASSVRTRDPAAVASAEPSAATPLPSPAAAQPPASATLLGNRYNVIGPSTKADPHAVRRAVESLAASSAPAPR
jgi:hypothetical protein